MHGPKDLAHASLADLVDQHILPQPQRLRPPQPDGLDLQLRQPPADDQVQQRQQDERGVAGRARQLDPGLAAADSQRLAGVQVVVRRDQRVLGDPVVSVAELLGQPGRRRLGEVELAAFKPGPTAQPRLHKFSSVH